MAITLGSLSIYMRIDGSAEVRVGSFTPSVDSKGIVAEISKEELAALFRSAADSLDAPDGG